MSWVGYLFAIIGFVATVYKSTQAWFSLKSFDWSEFDKISKKLIKKISRDNFYPDVIVTVGRGGAIVGAIISGNLPLPSSSSDKKNRNIPIIGTDRFYKWIDGHRVEIPNETIDFSPLENQTVLLVAADILSGGTMDFFFKSIKEAKPSTLKTACLVKGITTKFNPSYFGKEIPADFKMPWMYKGFGYSRDSRTDK